MKEGADEEEEGLVVVLTHVYREISRGFAKTTGMTLSRFLILHELMHAGETRQSELQRRLGMEGALLTRFAKEMEAAGLIARRVDPGDNRYTLVSLTPDGRRLLEGMKSLRKATDREMLRGLSKRELETTTGVMKRVQENLSRLLD